MSENISTVANSDLTTLHTLLTTQRTRRLDLVAGAAALKFEGGQLKIEGVDPVMDDSGVTDVNGLYNPNKVFDDSFAESFNIPRAYLTKLRAEGRSELIDHTGNHFLRGSSDGANGADPRNFTARLFRGDQGGTGVARALLSDRFRAIDNLDMLVTVLGGMADAGLGPENIRRCDLTEGRMFVQVVCPEIAVLAPELLKGYRSPYSGNVADENPVVFAGFVIGNSEVGKASASITPRITVKVCNNGMTMNKDAIRAIHVGQRKEDGIITYSEETVQKELELVALKTRDAVRTFLNPEYVTRQIRLLEEHAGVEVTKPEATIKAVVADSKVIPQSLEENIFAAFIKGGQLTAGGVMQAVTAVAQDQSDADLAYDMEAAAVNLVGAAARHAVLAAK